MANIEDSIDINVLSHVITSRRTVKPHNYSDRPVSKEIVEKIIENANWAPSHGRTYPWRFFVHGIAVSYTHLTLPTKA